jgi:hypothetical protein
MHLTRQLLPARQVLPGLVLAAAQSNHLLALPAIQRIRFTFRL